MPYDVNDDRRSDGGSSLRTATRSELATFRVFVNDKFADLTRKPPVSKDFARAMQGRVRTLPSSSSQQPLRRPHYHHGESHESSDDRRSVRSQHSQHSERSQRSQHSERSARSQGKRSSASAYQQQQPHHFDAPRQRGTSSVVSRPSARAMQGRARIVEEAIPEEPEVEDVGDAGVEVEGWSPSADEREGEAGREVAADGFPSAAPSPQDEYRPDFGLPRDDGMEGVMENSNPETLAEKKEILKALDELERQGLYTPRGPRMTLKSTKAELQYEYDSAQTDANTSQVVDMVKGVFKVGTGMLEGVADEAGFKLINGFHAAVTSDMARFNRPLTRLYKKHWRRGPISPELELGFIVIGSLVWVMFCNWKGMNPTGGIFGGPSAAAAASSGGGSGSSSEPFARGSIPAPFEAPRPPVAAGGVEVDTPSAASMPGLGHQGAGHQAAAGPPVASTVNISASPWSTPPPSMPSAMTPAPVPVPPPAHLQQQQQQQQFQQLQQQEELDRAARRLQELDKQAAARRAQMDEMDQMMAQRRNDFEKEMQRTQQAMLLQAQQQIRSMAATAQAHAPPAPHSQPQSPWQPQPQPQQAPRVVQLTGGGRQPPAASASAFAVRRTPGIDRLAEDMSRLSVQHEDDEDAGDDEAEVHPRVKRARQQSPSPTPEDADDAEETDDDAEGAGREDADDDDDLLATLQQLGVPTAGSEGSVDDAGDAGGAGGEDEAGDEEVPVFSTGRRSARSGAYSTRSGRSGRSARNGAKKRKSLVL